MKNTFKFIMAVALASSSLFFSCETTELELVESPNSLPEGTGDPSFLLNSIQLSYRNNAITFNGNGESLTRIGTFGSRDYFNGLTGGSLDGAWTRTYAGIFADVIAIEQLAEDPTQDLRFHLGTAKVMQAHSLLWLVDYIGDIPFTEALNPLEFPSPNVDAGASVYDGALGILNEGKALLESISAGDALVPAVDMFYDEDPTKWVKAANSIAMKAAITTGDIATFNAIVAEGNFITDAEDDLQFQYGTNLLNPNTQHPDYFANYTEQGVGPYRSNWLMGTMLENDDPRIRYYFYRQSGCTPGASCDPGGDGETLSCSLETAPTHYNGFTFCFLEDGYWGRDHGDDRGAPPDEFVKTATGVYPSGGKLDANNFDNLVVVEQEDGSFTLELDEDDDLVGLGEGGVGAGIEPIILSSYVDFWRAEAAMVSGDPGAAAGFIQSGLEKSIAKVQGFGDLDQSAVNGIISADIDSNTGELSNVVLANTLLPTSADNQDFIDDVVADFNNADTDGKWNILAEQFWITMYGGGAEAYNFYRRQGYPTTLQPNLEADPGAFPRSFPYTTAEIVANPNISQKPDQNVQVFWDTNPPSAVSGGFPAAN
ncbi:SusD/RagB family nutrient-binding outer membrane lipoprotein [Dokdonia donghaensis]|uniref:SusD/RagB family nutrient-binding outer membrane lipoprotein n=1 Tax=Dokdonia donghaensis DSW-1 TaxID=1300343 RepID=A0A0A2GW70_9FLAO|nr:SusD/RagB family nutrient-binding outer membrane lipoprotein [Dokdonia donghaensis]ANH60173.1 Starch-binding associating with outer membrane [Dokdonia donghaensis DSW-1]KGO07462.1 hypothetical protein NV36_11890 [Dokdonia donghaensis DSW-1]